MGALGRSPGAERDPEQTAFREAWEEAGLDPTAFTVLDTFLDDHGGWGFTTVFARARSRDIAFRLGRETGRLAWVSRNQISTLNLHPGLAATWNDLMRAFVDGRQE